MKNYFKILPILFWSIINGQVINCDKVEMISYNWTNKSSEIRFISPGSSLLIMNKTPTQVWNVLIKNKL